MDSLQTIHAKTRAAYNLAAQKYYDLFHNEMNEKEYDRKLLDAFAEKFSRDAVILDAGCGPAGHIGRYLFDKGLQVIGLDISEQCVALARKYNPEMRFEQGDLADLPFEAETFDGVLAYYAIIHTPKMYQPMLFKEFRRVLKPGGCLLVVVKAGTLEKYVWDLIGIETEIWFTLFTEDDIKSYFKQAGFMLDFMEKRNPYDFEIQNERIFAIGQKISTPLPGQAGPKGGADEAAKPFSLFTDAGLQ
jgi:ubiquinone/menaquinone biosynthesis C-methylase UbiE